MKRRPLSRRVASTAWGWTRHAIAAVDANASRRLRRGERARARSRIIDTNHAQDDDCSYDVRFRHGHVQLRVPCEHCRKKDWVGVPRKTTASWSLMAANPLTEKMTRPCGGTKPLMWEQGKLEEAPPRL